MDSDDNRAKSLVRKSVADAVIFENRDFKFTPRTAREASQIAVVSLSSYGCYKIVLS